MTIIILTALQFLNALMFHRYDAIIEGLFFEDSPILFIAFELNRLLIGG